MSKLALAGFVALWFAAASPAWACWAPSNEQYLLWFDLPELQPGEVAIEVDLEDTYQRLNNSTHLRRSGPFKVTRVIAGDFDSDTVQVKRDGSNCSHDIGGGATSRLLLVGKVEPGTDGMPMLTPRYMPYTHDFAVKARRDLEARGATDAEP